MDKDQVKSSLPVRQPNPGSEPTPGASASAPTLPAKGGEEMEVDRSQTGFRWSEEPLDREALTQ